MVTKNKIMKTQIFGFFEKWHIFVIDKKVQGKMDKKWEEKLGEKGEKYLQQPRRRYCL